MRRIRPNLTYANVMATLAVFLVLTGGTAVALQSSNNVFTDDIANDTRPASGGNPAGGLTAPDLRPNSVGSSEAANESLTGADIQNFSGVDTCPLTIRIGQLCVRAENDARPWAEAAQHCANLDLRLPSLAEALELAKTHDIPNVDDFESFWTGGRWVNPSTATFYGDQVNDNGTVLFGALTEEYETVCVTTPTN